MQYRVLLAAVVALAAPAALAYIEIGNTYGETVDRGTTYATVYPSASQADCAHAPLLGVDGSVYTIAIRRHLDGDTNSQPCINPPRVDLGVLSPGWYRVVLLVQAGDGVTTIERDEREFHVRALAGSCALAPQLRPQVYVEHPTMLAPDVARRIATDAEYAALLGNPIATTWSPWDPQPRMLWLTYPPLDDPPARRVALEATGQFSSVGANGIGCFATPPPDVVGDVIEFYHRAFDHYFYTLNAAEIAALDDGSVIRGWSRTGKSFRVVSVPGCPFRRSDVPVYRFYGKPGVGPDTHVFTINREECFGVASNGQWIYEDSPFWATTLTRAGTCANTSDIPLYRIWRPFGVSNHRFTTDAAVVADMAARGWIEEGPAMCVLAR